MCCEDGRDVARHEKLVLAKAYNDRRPQPGGDNLVRVFCGDSHHRICTGHRFNRFPHSFLERRILREFLDEVGDDFRVGFRDEFVAFGDELLLELDVVLDDPVVHDNDFAGAIAVRMGVFLGGASVRGPARVTDAVDSVERSNADRFLEIAQFAGGAANLELAVGADHGDPGRIISSVFEALQAVEDQRHHALRADIADNPAHLELASGTTFALHLLRGNTHMLAQCSRARTARTGSGFGVITVQARIPLAQV